MSKDEDAILAAMKAKAAEKKKANEQFGEMTGFSAAKPSKSESNLPKGEFHLKIYSPHKTYYDDIAYSVSAVNDAGDFDVLAGHGNFLTLVNPCEVTIRSKRGKESLKINRGVMHVKADEAHLFLDV
ncbi:MAG: hypothetical protein AAF413_01180 [Patescibacteria group bacterium]